MSQPRGLSPPGTERVVVADRPLGNSVGAIGWAAVDGHLLTGVVPGHRPGASSRGPPLLG
jgi:hypothetical protein